MKKTKLQLLLLLLFIGGLIILPQKAKAAEKAADIIPVNISVKYGQTEARTIFDMINEMRTNPYDTWCWDQMNTTKISCGTLSKLQYDYDLERVAMKRAAEIALSYDHERPMGKCDIYRQENISYQYAGENIAAGQTTASQVNDAWREDNELYDGQGHRRNMLSSKFNCVGIGHVYYNGVHYWVEEFAYRPEINTTKVLANDSTETVSVSVDKTKIKEVDVTFDQDSYSLRIGENTTPAIKETRIDVEYFWSGGRVLPKLEHQWNDGTVTKRATYETAGELTYRCRKCAAKRIISIEKLAYPKGGTSYTISGNEYKVSKPGAEVILVRTSKTTKNVTVPAQIYAQGITYKVTSIGAKAFNNNKKLTKVTIGTNIVKINSNAFFNCKNLKTVTIKSVRITGKTANKKAFKNAHKKLVIRVPKKVKKIYKQIFKGLKVK